MQPTEIKTGKATILVVKVPEGSKEFNIGFWGNPDMGGNNVQALYSSDSRPPIKVLGRIKEVGNWKLLGLSTELTEDQWKEILPKYKYDKHLGEYENYTDSDEYFKTATESGRSLLVANRFFEKNPYGRQPMVKGVCIERQGVDHTRNEYVETKEHRQWREVQDRIGSFLILIKEG